MRSWERIQPLVYQGEWRISGRSVRLSELPEEQAEVTWLSCVEGMSNQEIADHMNITAGEVRVLLHVAEDV